MLSRLGGHRVPLIACLGHLRNSIATLSEHSTSSKDFNVPAEGTTGSSASCEPEQVSKLSDSDTLVDPYDISLEQQQELLNAMLLHGRDRLVEFIDQHWTEIRCLAHQRHIDGYRAYRSTMYWWEAETRRRNALEEIADCLCYLSSGDV